MTTLIFTLPLRGGGWNQGQCTAKKKKKKKKPFNNNNILITLLKSYLINGHISTIININPLQEFYNETLTVLSFSSTVKEVALIVARIDSGLQTIKRPPIITPKSHIKKKFKC